MRILTVILLLASTISFSAFANDNKADPKPNLLSFITSIRLCFWLISERVSSITVRWSKMLKIECYK